MSDKIETIDVGKVDWNKTAVQYMELNKQKTEAIQRVRKLYEDTLKETVKGCSDDLEMFLSDLREALDGEQ
jgi:hypothetical protein